MGDYESDSIKQNDTAKDDSMNVIGGFMLPPGLKADMIRFTRARIRETKKLFPDMEKDPLYKAMKEISENWDQIMPGVELTWHLCATAAKAVMATRRRQTHEPNIDHTKDTGFIRGKYT